MDELSVKILVVGIRILAAAICISVSSFICMAPYAVYGLYLSPAIQEKFDNLEVVKAQSLTEVSIGNSSQQ